MQIHSPSEMIKTAIFESHTPIDLVTKKVANLYHFFMVPQIPNSNRKQWTSHPYFSLDPIWSNLA